MVGNIVAIHDNHDSSVSFYNGETGKYHIIELERLIKKRHYKIASETPNSGLRIEILRDCQLIAEKYWGIENDYECVLISSQYSDSFKGNTIKKVFNSKEFKTLENHHYTHAACAFYQSPFDEALILSYDGGGQQEYFNFYNADRNSIELVDKLPINLGAGYWLCGSLIKEIIENSKCRRSYPGKMMGLSGYGEVNNEVYDVYYKFMDRNLRHGYSDLYELDEIPDGKVITIPGSGDVENSWIYKGQDGYDIAATSQKIMEDIFFRELEKYDDEVKTWDRKNNRWVSIKEPSDIPLIITGGCALNVLINEEIKRRYDREVYVPPNPDDGGLTIGHIFCYTKPEERVNITYSGLSLMDRSKLDDYITEYDAKKVTKKDIAKLIKDGNIIGMVYGDSEVGPRALGNRSIICDPSISEMKDTLNAKVKFREWYRPFAPFCKKEDAHKYFESRDFENMEYMSFAVKVKVDTLPSITHVDGTARLQTVTQESHSHFYELLTEYAKMSAIPVLLNTSFNSRGNPILSTIYDALNILKETELDYVVIEDYLFSC